MKLGLTLAAASTAASTAAFCPVSVHNAQPAQSLPFNKYAPSPFAEPLSPFQSSPTSSYASVPTSLNYSDKHESNYLMDYFRTADGEIIDPYVVLKLGRGAEKQEIRQRYRTLSKQYHPDGARFTEVLPGKCNSLDDVRDEWERVKLAYEILSDKKLRLKYDRNSALNDPGAAVGRMALEAVGWGATGLTKGFMELGGLAVKSATKAMQKKEAVQKKADMNSNRNTRSVTRRRSTNSGSTYSNFPAAAGDVMMMNTNGMATALATNDFEFQQMYTHHAQGQVFVRDPLEDMARLAKDAFNWGMVAMAQGMHSFGDFAVRFAASEAKRHTDEWKYKR